MTSSSSNPSVPSAPAAPAEEYKVNPVLSRALDRIFILHADHEQNASTSTVRLAGSSGANPVGRPGNSNFGRARAEIPRGEMDVAVKRFALRALSDRGREGKVI